MECECEMRELMMNGCPSTKGGDCPAKGARLEQEVKRTAKPLKVIEADEDDWAFTWSVDPWDFQDSSGALASSATALSEPACPGCGEPLGISYTGYCTSCEAFRNQEGHYP